MFNGNSVCDNYIALSRKCCQVVINFKVFELFHSWFENLNVITLVCKSLHYVYNCRTPKIIRTRFSGELIHTNSRGETIFYFTHNHFLASLI
ncbi:hypothetical protein PBCV1_a610R [Paramecium bursaria Chlorella virus 1]|uniref:Uncharacterized protein n=1 Tax=Paramecium bursaria Chlorella virus 1 TaxID=10506 RepID=O41092_PBCV1|nr:hypothetical protein PBCV1_a610R [Paramecium bursaria Chlorella virus 1]AAC97023.1 hypothetical protein [Paramecium bursaria Chlorella virus 1]